MTDTLADFLQGLDVETVNVSLVRRGIESQTARAEGEGIDAIFTRDFADSRCRVGVENADRVVLVL